MSFQVICAWCGAVIRNGPPPPAPVSHGACDGCTATMLKSIEDRAVLGVPVEVA